MKFASSVRNVLLCFLLVTVFLAVPGASQAQQSATQTAVRADELTQSAVRQTQAAATHQPATLTAAAATRVARETAVAAQRTAVAVRQQLQQQLQLTAAAEQATLAAVSNAFPLVDPHNNPADISSCGLPTRSASFFSGSATLEMTANCSFSSGDLHRNAASILDFTSGGPYTINGNGHSIIGPTILAAINVGNGVTVNLNNVVIRSSGGAQAPVVRVNGGTLNATNVTFQDNRALAVIIAQGSAQTRLTNARFQDNRINGDSILDIQAGSLTLEGRIGFRANPSALLGGEANYYTVGIGTFNDNGAVIYTIQLPKKKKKEEVRPTLAATPRPRYAASYTALQTATGMTFEATYGLDSGVHFRQLDGAGIGIQSIIDAGYLAALDVYGYVEQGVEVCFPQAGRVIFLDARTIPRAITTLPATARDGMTCVYLNSPGSLVLLPPN